MEIRFRMVEYRLKPEPYCCITQQQALTSSIGVRIENLSREISE